MYLNMKWLQWITLSLYGSYQADVGGLIGEWIDQNMQWLYWIVLG